MKNRRFRGLKVASRETGNGDAIVLLHAGGSSSRQWDEVCKPLEGFRTIALDMFGFGDSDRYEGPEPLDHDDYADLLATIAAEHGGRLHVVGHSYGGSAAMRYAVRYRHQIDSLTLIEPVLPRLLRDAGETDLYEDYKASADRFLSLAEDGAPDTAWRSFFDRYNGDGAWAALPEKARAKRLSQTEATADAFRANLANPMTLKRCQSLRLPVLVISGSDTTAPDKRVAEILGTEIPGANHVIIPEAGHMSPVTHPAEVAAAILAHAGARAPA